MAETLQVDPMIQETAAVSEDRATIDHPIQISIQSDLEDHLVIQTCKLAILTHSTMDSKFGPFQAFQLSIA